MLRALSLSAIEQSMKQRITFLLATACIGAVAGDDVEMRRCRELRDAAARLACYDVIPLTAASSSGASTPATAPPVAATFGLEFRPSPAAPLPITSIESVIDGAFDGWLPRGQLKLTNGQIWEVTDGSTTAYRLQSPKVKVTRGVSGTFFMAIEGVAQTPRVRRVR